MKENWHSIGLDRQQYVSDSCFKWTTPLELFSPRKYLSSREFWDYASAATFSSGCLNFAQNLIKLICNGSFKFAQSWKKITDTQLHCCMPTATSRNSTQMYTKKCSLDMHKVLWNKLPKQTNQNGITPRKLDFVLGNWVIYYYTSLILWNWVSFMSNPCLKRTSFKCEVSIIFRPEGVRSDQSHFNLLFAGFFLPDLLKRIRHLQRFGEWYI